MRERDSFYFLGLFIVLPSLVNNTAIDRHTREFELIYVIIFCELYLFKEYFLKMRYISSIVLGAREIIVTQNW